MDQVWAVYLALAIRYRLSLSRLERDGTHLEGFGHFLRSLLLGLGVCIYSIDFW